jgi:hypothetical protein
VVNNSLPDGKDLDAAADQDLRPMRLAAVLI